MKKIIVFVCCIFINFSIYAQNKINDKCFVTYRQAVSFYDSQEYGKALEYAENAITYRKQQVEQEIKILQNSLSTKQVKSVGDRIDKILAVLKERGEQNCIDIINSYVKKYDTDKFNNSMNNLLSFINNQSIFPEAEILIGNIYKIEGEYDFAEKYYLKALENSDVFDIPDDKYAVLYILAELSKLQNKNDEYEKRLLNITGIADTNRNTLIINNMRNTIKKNNKDTLEKFFVMYRSYDYYSLDAYCQLADYYFSVNQDEKALGYCALAVITGFSKCYNLIQKRNLTFEYNDLQSFLKEIHNYDDIVKWGNENRVWESFNLLCNISFKLGYNTFAKDLLVILSKESPEKYWQESAVLTLDKMDN